MRSAAALLLAAVCLWPKPLGAQSGYAAVLLEYLAGNADAALTTLSKMDQPEIKSGVEAFDTTRARQILTGAAAMHTEAAIRPQLGGFTDNFHLGIATAIVEFGERSGHKRNATLVLQPKYATPVSDEFRKAWYCAVINGMQSRVRMDDADKYLEHALALFPRDPEIQLLAGIAQEMRASPRTSSPSEGDRRKALKTAEDHFRAALAAAPDRVEARLRLGRVLQLRGAVADARTQLAPLIDAENPRIAYLASLFVGGLDDRTGHVEAAATGYERAAALLPSAQAARLALSELRHRGGDRQAAADAIPAAAGAGNEFDPWWTYVFGEYWRADELLAGVRRLRRS